MDLKYLTDSESLSLNIEATFLLLSSPRNFPYEINMDKYRPYPSMISMFTSYSQHPPRSRHGVHLGEYTKGSFPIIIRVQSEFKDMPHGTKVARPVGHMYYIGLYRENIKKIFLSKPLGLET